jgi:hypothetical protein
MLPPAGQEVEPPTLLQIALLPGVFLLLGVLIWFIGWNREKDDGRGAFVKWLAYIPLALALLMSYEPFFRMFTDPPYVEEVLMNSRRLIYAGVYPSFLLPLVAAVGFLAWYFYDRKMSQYR